MPELTKLTFNDTERLVEEATIGNGFAVDQIFDTAETVAHTIHSLVGAAVRGKGTSEESEPVVVSTEEPGRVVLELEDGDRLEFDVRELVDAAVAT